MPQVRGGVSHYFVYTGSNYMSKEKWWLQRRSEVAHIMAVDRYFREIETRHTQEILVQLFQTTDITDKVL